MALGNPNIWRVKWSWRPIGGSWAIQVYLGSRWITIDRWDDLSVAIRHMEQAWMPLPLDRVVV